MEQLLSVVEDVFELRGRGCVITPGVPVAPTPMVSIQIGDALRLVRPDGSSVTTTVAGIEMIGGGSIQPRPTPLLLHSDISKEDVPPGTRVYVDAADT